MGNSEQVQYSGKNKFKNLANTITRSSLTMINDGKTISIKGTNSSNMFYPSFIFYADGSIVTVEWWPTLVKIDTTKGYFTESEKTYMFSLLKNGTYNGEKVVYFIGKETNIAQYNIDTATTYTNLIASNSEKINFVAIGFFPNQQVDLTFEIQIEEGSTSTEYEPYVGGTASPNPDYPQPITNVTGDVEVLVQNKNLFDKDNSNILNYYMTSTGTIGASVFDKLFYINCNPSTTYTIQKIIGTSGRFRIGSFANIPSVGDEPNVFVVGDNQTTKVITTGVNDKYLAVQYFASDSNEQAILDSIQVEKGSTATTYVAHKEQTLPLTLGNIELCKIGDYQDYFWKDETTNKWYLHKKIGKYAFNGSESFNFVEITGVNVFINNNILSNLICKSTNEINIISDYFLGTIDNQGNVANSIRSNNSGQVFITVPTSNPISASASAFKTWLSNNNVTTYYKLATPTYTEITDTTLINQLEAISKALSYEEQTNISSNQNPIFNVEAYQSTKLVLEEMATAIVALGGV